MKSLLRSFICGAAVLCVSLGVMADAWAGAGCRDRYAVSFAVKPAGESYFIHPDQLSAELSLPLTWRAIAGAVELILDVKRVDTQAQHIALAKTAAGTRSVFLVRLLMDEWQPLTYRGRIVDQTTGDTWVVELVPACAPA